MPHADTAHATNGSANGSLVAQQISKASQPAKSAVPSNITRQLADFVYKATWNDIQPIYNVLQCGILDYIGLASYAVRHVTSSDAFIQGINALSADGPGTALGLSRSYQPQYSALLNGTMVHSMDWDDTNSVASLHPGATAISAALAQTELEMSLNAERRVCGREFYTAVAVGYEVTCRIGRSISDVLHQVGFHPTSVAGVFGAAAVVGKLAGFDADQIDSLFGVVGSLASGSLQFLEYGGYNKRFHPGIAAHNAIIAGQLVKAGIIGAKEAIEGGKGISFSYARMTEPDLHIVDELGKFWETCNTAIKPYPCCRLCHGPIEAAYELRTQFPNPELLTEHLSFEVTVGGKAYGGTGIPAANKIRPTSVVEGQFSLYFQFAVAFLYGRNDWDSYNLLQNEKVLALCRRITVHTDHTLREGSLVTVAEVGDKTVKIEYPLGEPERPMGLAEVQGKVVPMLEKVYGQQRSKDILNMFYDLENQTDVKTFVKSLRA